jgi:hypothetical protein
MDHTHFQEGSPRALRDVSTALFALRDALVELSLSLKDMQFETNLEERNKVAASFRELLEKVR